MVHAHQRLRHDDPNLALCLGGEVDKQALEDILSWLTVWVHIDGQHGRGSFLLVCPGSRWNRRLDVTVADRRS